MAELLRRISSRELSEWMAYYAIEPWGAERDNLHAGVIAAATVNVWQGEKDDPVKPQDFMLQFGEDEKEPLSADELYGMFQTWALLNGAKRGNDAEDPGS